MITLNIAGDYSPRERVQALLDGEKWNDFFLGINEINEKSQCSIINFESTISEKSDSPIVKRGTHLSTTSKSMFALKKMGFDTLTFANNHALDYGGDALLRTMEEAKRNGFDVVGAGQNSEDASKVLFKKVNGQSIAIINACEHEFSIATETEPGCNPLNIIPITRAIYDVKAKVDYVIVIIHGGIEHYQLPSPRMKETYRFFIDAGADAVINHHQHCFCGYEVYNDKPIFYGLGNFCFDSSEDNKYRQATWNYGFIVQLTLYESKVDFALHPYEQCYQNPTVRLFLPNSEEYDAFFKKIEELNAIIADDEKLKSEFKKNALSKRESSYSFLSPYTNGILTSLLSRKLVPSFVNKFRLLNTYSRISCESHRDTLVENLITDYLKNSNMSI